MTVTWHWEDPGVMAHARRDEDGPTLCGGEANSMAIMRPVFPKMRCKVCDAIKGNELESYPNRYQTTSIDDGGEPMVIDDDY